MKKMLSFLMLLSLTSCAALAFAAEPVAATAEPTFKLWLIDTILPALSALILGLVPVVLAYLARKFKLEGEWTKEAKYDKIAEQAAQYAEESIERMLKDAARRNVDIGKPSKLDEAVRFFEKAAPGLAADQMARLVHVALAKLKGVGATGEKVIR